MFPKKIRMNVLNDNGEGIGFGKDKSRPALNLDESQDERKCTKMAGIKVRRK